MVSVGEFLGDEKLLVKDEVDGPPGAAEAGGAWESEGRSGRAEVLVIIRR